MSEEKKQIFEIVNLYLKDLSFESPNSPYSFNLPGEESPDINFDVATDAKTLDEKEGLYEAVLSLTVSTKSKGEDSKTLFLVEAKQAGVFALTGFKEEELEQILAVTAQEILFPYAREVVSSLVARGGYPQLLLPPINFMGIYLENKEKETVA